ncbi:GntR family transcriptional regulator [Actinokineospora bangkokensis]|uniref:HTH gntR-type domain-containing protein n=1 Tax=Actinokineospora bangkokensis TaxID=1193682 RepID=A0A1Q9LJK4_9PSEU|nr:GntR family transcriptional regulator [Actinokineospora bangkokensis]OLR92208.1 hypothetical protein BJP25_23055 [Actinokineospora bangkokensis]
MGPLREQFPPVAISKRAAQVLRAEIAEGVHRPGDRLIEAAVGEELGISRNTVREAFAELEAERLIVRAPHRGVFVAQPGRDDVRDVYALRRVVEVGAVLTGPDTTAVARAREAVEEAVAARARGDMAALGSANNHFHRAVVAMAASSRLDATMEHVLAEMRLLFLSPTTREDFHLGFVDANGAICAALERDRRQEAADLLAAYLDRAERALLDMTG